MQTIDSQIQTVGQVTLIPSGKDGKLSANSLWVAEAGLLIDTGADRARYEEIQSEVRCVLYTHAHSDHRWHANLFANAETLAHTRDARALETIEGMVDAVARDTFGRAALEGWFKANVTPIRVDRRIEDETELPVNGIRLVPLHMPGHTPGLLCPYFPDERLVFLTDYDLTKFGPWYGNTTSDLDAFEASLRRIANFDADWFMTSHLPGALRREEMLALLEPFALQISRRDSQLVDLLAKPQTLAELSILGLCYKATHLARDPFLQWFERLQIEHHLNRLESRGLVKRDGEYWRRA